MKYIVIVLTVVVLAGGGIGAYAFLGKSKAGAPGESGSVGPVVMYPMEPFIVNLSDREGKRYLKAKIELEVTSEAAVRDLKTRDAQIRDSILLYLSSHAYADISTLEGKALIKDEIVARVGQVVGTGKVRTLYFTEFVVQ